MEVAPRATRAPARASLSLLAYTLRLAAARLAWPLPAALRLAAALLGWLAARPGWARSSPVARRLELRAGFDLRRWHALAAAYVAYRAARAAAAAARHAAGRGARRAAEARVRAAETRDEWLAAVEARDAALGRAASGGAAAAAAAGGEPAAAAGLRAKAAALRGLAGDAAGTMWALRQDCFRDIAAAVAGGGGGAPPLRDVPPAVAEYLEEAAAALARVRDAPALPLDDRLAFFRELRHAYGRTALVLSGGGSFGFWHFGVIRALLKAGLMPRVVSGSSAGALACALLATRTDAELLEVVDQLPAAEGSIYRQMDFFGAEKSGLAAAWRLLWHGALHDHAEFVPRLQRLMGATLTFAEAYARTGRILNVAVTAADTHEPPRLLNYLTAPNVLVWSAVACSSAFPLLFAPQELLAKTDAGEVEPYAAAAGGGGGGGRRRWCDGSLEEDLPMQGLSECFGCNLFIVSQCNPYLLPVLAALGRLPPRAAALLEWEVKHRFSQLLALAPRSRLLKLLCQPWRGDLNCVMPLREFPLLQSTRNFSPSDIHAAMRAGQRSVWAQLPAIRAACAVEVAIDGALGELARRAAARRRREERVAALEQRLRSSSARLPSWLHLPSLGLPHSESAEAFRGGAGGAEPGSPTALDAGSKALVAAAAAALGEAEAQAEAEGKDGGAGADAPPPPPPPGFEGGAAAARDLAALAVGRGLDVIAP